MKQYIKLFSDSIESATASETDRLAGCLPLPNVKVKFFNEMEIKFSLIFLLQVPSRIVQGQTDASVVYIFSTSILFGLK